VSSTPTEGAEQAEESRRAALAGRHFFLSLRSPDSYGLVLVTIIVTYVIATSLTENWGVTILLFVQIATVRLALRTSRARRGIRLIANLLLVLAAVAAVANLFVDDDSDLVPFVFMAGSILYVVAPFSIVRHIAYRREIDQETLLGALSAYLLIGMTFAFAYRFVAGVQSDPFFGADGDGTVSQDLFFSFVTLTTTGYGNLVPAGNPGQSLAVVEALIGQLFLVTAVGKIVSAWRPRGWRTAAGTDEGTADDAARAEDEPRR
jgi:hypothetical protein